MSQKIPTNFGDFRNGDSGQKLRSSSTNSSGSCFSNLSNLECSYCKSIGEKYDGHTNKRCDRLAEMNPCKFCGASGYQNHTTSHCTMRPKPQLEHLFYLNPDRIMPKLMHDAGPTVGEVEQMLKNKNMK